VSILLNQIADRPLPLLGGGQGGGQATQKWLARIGTIRHASQEPYGWTLRQSPTPSLPLRGGGGISRAYLFSNLREVAP
jgi:hypothetical protein